MANVYCISYDLNQQGQAYSTLYEKIKECEAYLHCLDSTWLVTSHKTAQQIYDHLKGAIDSNDHFLVIKVNNEYQGWLPDYACQWLREHLSEI